MKIGLIAHYGEDYYKSRVDFLDFLDKKVNETYAFVPNDSYKDKIDALNNKVYYYSYSRSWRFVFSLISTYLFFVKKIKKEKTDIIFTYKFFPNIVGILAARKAKVPQIIATIAGIGFLENRDKNILVKLVFLVYMWILNKATIVVAQNIDDLNLLKEHLTNPKVILTNGSGINPDNFKNGENYNFSFLEKNKLSSEKKYITFCSRIVKEKGILELIKAYNKVDINYELLIAGWFDEKSLEAEALNLIKTNPKIHYLGYQKNVEELLSVSDIILLPSYYPEGVPRSLIEALSLGKVIITTDHKGCKETCIDQKNGFLVEPRSVDSLVEIFNKVDLLSKAELDSFKENSVRLFNEKFHRDVVYNTIWNAIN